MATSNQKDVCAHPFTLFTRLQINLYTQIYLYSAILYIFCGRKETIISSLDAILMAPSTVDLNRRYDFFFLSFFYKNEYESLERVN